MTGGLAFLFSERFLELALQLDLFTLPSLPPILELKEQAGNCTACPLHCVKDGKVAFSDGSEKAKVMIVSDAPGPTEELLGKPFVGRSGQLLDRALESIQLRRDTDVYLTNVCKHRASDNRISTLEEQKICSELFLKKEIEIVKPNLIVALGAPALKFFKPTMTNITSERGKWWKWNDTLVLSIFQPAYVLRNPSQEKGSPADLFWSDFKELKRAINERVWE